jgi:tripartite-type tricarboxylate transporter receptor subunit TctC
MTLMAACVVVGHAATSANPTESAAYIRCERDRWAKVIKTAGIRLE